MAVQERAASPELVTLGGLIALRVSPVGRGLSDNETVPAKPLIAVTVIVDVAAVEPSAGTEEGEVALIAKSLKSKVAVAV